MGGAHKHPPIPFRPPAGSGIREWLEQHSAATGQPVNRILADAVAAYRASCDHVQAGGGDERAQG